MDKRPRILKIPSTAAIFRHPVHPMLVVYPLGFLNGALATDLCYWWTADPFWAQASFWLILAGLAMGGLAAAAGTIDFLTIRQVRKHMAGWNHFLAAVMVLALASANLRLRLDRPLEEVLSWGLLLSGATALMTVFAGWLGGNLTFRHSIGTYGDDTEENTEP